MAGLLSAFDVGAPSRGAAGDSDLLLFSTAVDAGAPGRGAAGVSGTVQPRGPPLAHELRREAAGSSHSRGSHHEAVNVGAPRREAALSSVLSSSCPKVAHERRREAAFGSREKAGDSSFLGERRREAAAGSRGKGCDSSIRGRNPGAPPLRHVPWGAASRQAAGADFPSLPDLPRLPWLRFISPTAINPTPDRADIDDAADQFPEPWASPLHSRVPCDDPHDLPPTVPHVPRPRSPSPDNLVNSSSADLAPTVPHVPRPRSPSPTCAADINTPPPRAKYVPPRAYILSAVAAYEASTAATPILSDCPPPSHAIVDGLVPPALAPRPDSLLPRLRTSIPDPAPLSSAWLRGRWYMSTAPARVQPRTLFPTSWTSGSTLQRRALGSGLAGGFQRVVKVDFVATTLTLAFLGKCLVGQSCYASSSRTTPRAQLRDVSRR